MPGTHSLLENVFYPIFWINTNFPKGVYEMKIVKKLFFVLMMISCICTVSCGGGGGGSSDGGGSTGGTLYIPAVFSGNWFSGDSKIIFDRDENEIQLKIASNPDVTLTVIDYNYNNASSTHQFQIDAATPYWIEMAAPVGNSLTLKAANMNTLIAGDMNFLNYPTIPSYPPADAGSIDSYTGEVLWYIRINDEAPLVGYAYFNVNFYNGDTFIETQGTEGFIVYNFAISAPSGTTRIDITEIKMSGTDVTSQYETVLYAPYAVLVYKK